MADGLRRKVRALSDALAVARAVRRVRPDIIHLHCTNPVVLAYLALLRLSRAPLVYTAHVVTPHEPIPLQSLIYGLVYRLAPWIVAHSRFDRARLIDEFGVGADRIEVVPHGEYGFFARHGEAPPDRATITTSCGRFLSF